MLSPREVSLAQVLFLVLFRVADAIDCKITCAFVNDGNHALLPRLWKGGKALLAYLRFSVGIIDCKVVLCAAFVIDSYLARLIYLGGQGKGNIFLFTCVLLVSQGDVVRLCGR